MLSAELVLCDTGPLVALFSAGQYAQQECQKSLRELRGGLMTTLPVLTEAFHFLDQPCERELLWTFIASGVLRLADISQPDLVRIRGLMDKYADSPMDFADASLVVVAERLKVRRVLTLDRHFRLYRPRHARAFEIFP